MESKKISAFTNDLIGRHDAFEISKLIRKKEISAHEVYKCVRQRLAIVNPILNACVDINEDADKKIIDNSLDTTVFMGVPTFIKDNTDVAGYKTGYGSKAVPNSVAKNDSIVTQQIKSLGLTVIGKSSLPEFGFNCTTEFLSARPSINPWNTDYSCGGSSGGAASLVASGVVPIAHANDGGGSIRIPAALCGLVGLKPTRNRLVQQIKSKKMPIKIICEGAVTRTVRDTAYFYYGCELFWHNKQLPKIGLVEGPNQQRRKIAMILDSLTGPTEDEIKNAVSDVAKLLTSLGHEVELIKMPVSSMFVDDFADYWSFLAFTVEKFGVSYFGRDFKPEHLDHLTKGLAKRFQKKFWRLPTVLLRLHRSKHDLAQALKNYDAVLTPVVGHHTPKIGEFSPMTSFEALFQRLLQFVNFTPINNAAGTPAISLPTGLSSKGLPIGVQLSSHYGQERILLELAYELEAQGCFVKF